MQVCTSLQTDNHASTPPLSFFQAGWPFCCPANGIKALKAAHVGQHILLKTGGFVVANFYCPPALAFVPCAMTEYIVAMSLQVKNAEMW